ncbi:MAG: helix-turn-helix transcriptional regulator [Patescibacteria group bacterium]|nr:helix-turn-helix transcriptional regulator [Patescibacteria group bacterium]
MLIGPTIRALRERAGLTQEQLAKRAGINRVSLANIERNAANPQFQTIAKIVAGIPGVNMEEFREEAERYETVSIDRLDAIEAELKVIGERQREAAVSDHQALQLSHQAVQLLRSVVDALQIVPAKQRNATIDRPKRLRGS